MSQIVDDVFDPSEFLKLYRAGNERMDVNQCQSLEKVLTIEKIHFLKTLAPSRFNQKHFQGNTLTEFRKWHDLGQAYAKKKLLTLALVLNAFATHYLEDFFAPGHLIAPRTEIPNLAAWALHKDINKQGANIKVNFSPDLEIYLELIKKFDLTSENGVTAILANQEKVFIFKGDGRVEEALGQEELIIAMVAKTITDIFKTYRTEVGKSITDICETYPTEEMSKSFVSDYVYTLLTGHRYQMIGGNFDDLSYETIKIPLSGTKKVYILEGSGYLSAPIKKDYHARFGVETGITGFISGRLGFLNLDFQSVGFGWDVTLDPLNIGIHNWSHGPFFKYNFFFKGVDIMITPYVKYKINYEKGNRFNSIQYGGRFGISLDFLSIFVGAGDEPRYTGKKESVFTVYAGVSLYFPVKTFYGPVK